MVLYGHEKLEFDEYIDRCQEPGYLPAAAAISDEEYEEYMDEYDLEPDEFTTMEMLAVAAAREVYEDSVAFTGTGLPVLAITLAQQSTAPSSVVIYEAGMIGPKLEHVAISVSDPRGGYRASFFGSMMDTFLTAACRGFQSIGFLGGAECDKYGNLNATAIGGYLPGGVPDKEEGEMGYTPPGKGPKVRFAGSGGSNPISGHADKLICMMVHEERRFPEHCEYITSTGTYGPPGGEPGYWAGERSRQGIFRGLAAPEGQAVVSDLCIMRPNPETHQLAAYYIMPGMDEKIIQDHTGFDVNFDMAEPFPEPSYDELKILRMNVDPTRIYLSRKTARELKEEQEG